MTESKTTIMPSSAGAPSDGSQTTRSSRGGKSGFDSRTWTQNTWTPYQGWKFIFDQYGTAHHVPDRPLLDEMCKLYYGDIK